jgi:hypothetical protein
MYYITIPDMFRAILCSSSGGLNCIVTASGIVTLCKRPYSAPVESGLHSLYSLTSLVAFESPCTRECALGRDHFLPHALQSIIDYRHTNVRRHSPIVQVEM